jgi:hypothetical protein
MAKIENPYEPICMNDDCFSCDYFDLNEKTGQMTCNMHGGI